MKRIFLVILLLFILYGWTRVPITGRRQISFIPAVAMNTLAATSYRETLATSQLSNNAEQTAMIERVGKRISKAVEEFLITNNMSSTLWGFQWEFVLIEDPTVNAWCMPGGRIAFYTGILPVCENEDGVAVVMGHEIAHAIANHGGERMSQQLLVMAGEFSLEAALRKRPQETQQLALAVFGVGSQIFGILPYSRLHEYEADRLGLIFMAMAGYNPNEGPKFWERMMRLSGNRSASDFLSTHPSNAKRIDELNTAIPEAMGYYKPH